jgi:hypothetical protein
VATQAPSADLERVLLRVFVLLVVLALLVTALACWPR